MDAANFPEVFKHIKSQVLPAREKAAAKEEARNKAVLSANPKAKVNNHHANFLKSWWRMSYDREDMIESMHKSRAPAHGYKAHIAADKDTGIIRKVETAPANEPDVNIAPSIIPDAPGEVFADKAYDALSVEKAIIAAGGTSRLMRKGHRWLPAKALEAHNRPLRASRSRIEQIFGTWKRSYRFRCMRWIGLAKQSLQVHLAAIAYNFKRYWRLQTA